jgi:hypothetical protein
MEVLSTATMEVAPLRVVSLNDAGAVKTPQSIPAISGVRWDLLPGKARDIGVGANGTVWVIGTAAAPGGYSIHRWTGSAWQRIAGGAVRIDVDGAGNAWIVNNAGDICRWTGSSWQKLPGKARDIGVDANGRAWVIGTAAAPGGYTIHRWTGSAWQRIAGGAMRIDVDGAGNAWIVNSTGAICRWTGSSWQKLPGQARDIGVGANGTAWIIGWDAVKGGYSIQCWTANSWQRVNGGAIGISVGPDGKVWIVNNELQICRGNPFQSQPYSGIDGTWQSNWGPVTISTRADPVDPNAWIVTGGWQQGSNQHGVFNGTYRGGILTFRYYQPWNKKWGNAWFSVMEDKRSMKGWYQHDGSSSRDAWNLWR